MCPLSSSNSGVFPHRGLTQGSLNLGSTRLEYWHRAAGAGRTDPVVFLHPWRGCWRVWQRTIDALDDHECIAVDLYSPGRGDWTRWASPEGLAAAVLALLDHQRIARCALVGNSMGGVIAQIVASDHPQRVSALVLVGVGARSSSGSAAHQANVSWLSAPPDVERTRERVSQLFARPPADAELASYVECVMSADRAFFAACMQSATGFDMRARLRRVSVPTLIVRGALDEIATRDRVRELADAIPGSKSVEIAGAGHCPQVDRADAFVRVLRHALGPVGPGGR